jgi:hypothetical protein
MGPYVGQAKAAMAVLEDRRLAAVLADERPEDWTLLTVARYDHLLRTRLRSGLENVRNALSELDVYIGVGNLARPMAGVMPGRCPNG